ncbi:hypothetical protein ZHAS_00012119 [Anopheles sinensis]|uniref:Uncharacterized protein n=1 Tax=Anopheles sinensis TaxID=74873 RepID=A0A084W1Y2_ANOSI|nr:hypothetical protein ZHAS_00012119 [Anopheles sinensis]
MEQDSTRDGLYCRGTPTRAGGFRRLSVVTDDSRKPAATRVLLLCVPHGRHGAQFLPGAQVTVGRQ